jgi:hypothetical protein
MSLHLSTRGLGSVKSVKRRNYSQSQLKLPLMTYQEFIQMVPLKNVPKRLYGLKYGTYLSKNRS